MIFNHKNVSGTGTQVLSAAVTNATKVYTVDRLLICNTDSTNITATVRLNDGTDTFQIAHNVTIPIGITLDVFRGIPFQYEKSYALEVILGNAGYTADIIFNQY
jgi:hypothetical protein